MLMKKNPAALRYTKECIRAVRHMDVQQAADYLNAKSDALRFRDPEKGRAEATKPIPRRKKLQTGIGRIQTQKTGLNDAQVPDVQNCTLKWKGRAAARPIWCSIRTC